MLYIYYNKQKTTQNNYLKTKMEKVSNGENIWDTFNEITQFRHKNK